MKIEEFSLERIQSLYENLVPLNLSDSGVHPMTIREMLNQEQIDELLDLELGYGWTNGEVSLRETIASLYKDRGPDDIVVTNGSCEANFLMVMALLDPGDEIVVFTPNYLQIYGWARSIGIDVKTVQHDESAEWQADLQKLRETVSSKTRLITICNPNNPTGATLSIEAMHELVEIAREHDIYLHADEVYKGSELTGDEPPSIADLYEKAIATNGLSKAMALPGLRIGWLAGPAKDIYAAWQRKDYTSITTSAVSEYIAERVLQPELRHKILNRSKGILRENLDLLQNWVAANSDTVSLVPPKAGGMAFIRYNRDISSTELAHTLRTEKGVFVLPGDVYGLDGYFRVGIGAPRSHLEPGLEKISEYFSTTQFNELAQRSA